MNFSGKDKKKKSLHEKEEKEVGDSKKESTEGNALKAKAVQSYRHVSTYNGRFTEQQTMILADFFLTVSTNPTPSQVDELYNQVLLFVDSYSFLNFSLFIHY